MDFVKNLRRLKVLCLLLSNLMMVIQIVLIVLVLLLSSYAFLQLLNSTALDFLYPVVAFAKSFVQYFFGNTIKASQPEIDGELVLFIVIDIIVIFVVSQLKVALKSYNEQLDKKIVEEKAKIEVKFNKALDDELHRSIASYSNFMLAFNFNVCPLVADAIQIYGVEKIDEVKVEAEISQKIVNHIKSIPGVKLSRKGKDFLVTSSNFKDFDKIIDSIYDLFAKLRKAYRAQKVVVKSRFAVETYKPLTPSSKVYAAVKPLLDLNIGHDALCYGNFKNRYAMLKDPSYTVQVKGKYDIDDVEETIYCLVKKDKAL